MSDDLDSRTKVLEYFQTLGEVKFTSIAGIVDGYQCEDCGTMFFPTDDAEGTLGLGDPDAVLYPDKRCFVEEGIAYECESCAAVGQRSYPYEPPAAPTDREVLDRALEQAWSALNGLSSDEDLSGVEIDLADSLGDIAHAVQNYFNERSE